MKIPFPPCRRREPKKKHVCFLEKLQRRQKMEYNYKRTATAIAYLDNCKAITASDVVKPTWKCNGVTNLLD